MAGELRTRNSAFLCKIESTEGVDAAPDATNAILVEEVQSGLATGFIESTELTGSLDAGAPAVIGAPTSWTLRFRLRGVTGTPGVGNLPPADALLQALGFERVATAAITAAALTAGSATTATLGTGYGTTAQMYRGMPLIFSGTNHPGKVGLITDYTAGKVATLADTYSPVLSTGDSVALPANILYKPRSSGVVSVTAYHYVDGLLRKLVGARATGSLQMDAAGIPVFSLTLTGTFAGETDASIPAGAQPSGIAAPLFVQGALPSPAFVMNRSAVGIAAFSLDLGNGLTSPADPNTVNGFGGGILVSRDTRLSVNPQAQLVATRDVVAQLQQGTNFPVAARAGSAAGNRLSILAPSAQIIEAPDADDGGILRRSMQLKLNGADLAALLCIY
jgi:hypothetical protein